MASGTNERTRAPERRKEAASSTLSSSAPMKATGAAVDDIAPSPAGDDPKQNRDREQSRADRVSKRSGPARGLPLLETFSRVIRATGRWDLSRGPVCQTMTTSCLDSGADHARKPFSILPREAVRVVASTVTEYAQDRQPTTPQYLLHKSLVTTDISI